MPSVYRALFLACLPFTLAFRIERRQAVPADFSSLPGCGQTCFIKAATAGNTGCSIDQFKCLAQSHIFKDSVIKCVLSSCSSTEQKAVAKWATKTSASLGTPLDLSGAAAAAGATPGKKETPAPEKPSSGATTGTKPGPAKQTPTNHTPEYKPTSPSSNQQSANRVTPIATDGSSADSKDTQSSATAAPGYTGSSKSNSATKADYTTSASDNTKPEGSGSSCE